MPIADGKEVTVSQAKHVRDGDVRILVHLIRIVGRKTSLRRERKLRDAVAYRLLLLL